MAASSARRQVEPALALGTHRELRAGGTAEALEEMGEVGLDGLGGDDVLGRPERREHDPGSGRVGVDELEAGAVGERAGQAPVCPADLLPAQLACSSSLIRSRSLSMTVCWASTTAISSRTWPKITLRSGSTNSRMGSPAMSERTRRNGVGRLS